jgi:hypothetical protein
VFNAKTKFVFVPSFYPHAEKEHKTNRTLLKKLEQNKKKVYFFIAFVHELPASVIDSARITINIMWKQLQQQHTSKK